MADWVILPLMKTDESERTGADIISLSQQCTATSKSTGTQCGKHAIPGGNVCRFHGGAAPQVRAAALHRIIEARNLAVDRMIEQLAPPESPLYAIEFRELVNAVDKLTGKIQLLSGEATSRDESVKVGEVRHRLELKLDQVRNRAMTQVPEDSIIDVESEEEGE